MMALDTSIYRQQQPQNLLDILSAYDEADARKARAEGNQLLLAMRKQEFDAGQRAQERQGRLNGLMSTFGPDATASQRAQRLRSSGFWQEADAVEDSDIKRQKAQADVGKVNAEADKLRLADTLEKFSVATQIMSGVSDQASYDAAKQQAAQMFGADQIANWPASYDPVAIEQRKQQALTVQQQIEQEWKRKGYDLDVKKQDEVARHNAAAEATARGQLAVAQGNLGVARQNAGLRAQELQFNRDLPKGQYDPERGVIVDPRTGQAKPVVGADGQPLAPKKPSEATAKVTEAKEAIALIDQADQLIGKATGSYVGKGIDMAGRAIGLSTPGAEAAAQLKALEGALVSKMPKMSGPQSDKDVQLYRQMAGMIGDETVPAEQKRAALRTVREIQERYAGVPAGSSAPNPRSSSGTVKNQALEDALNKYR